jgi:hypothetical protein
LWSSGGWGYHKLRIVTTSSTESCLETFITAVGSTQTGSQKSLFQCFLWCSSTIGLWLPLYQRIQLPNQLLPLPYTGSAVSHREETDGFGGSFLILFRN